MIALLLSLFMQDGVQLARNGHYAESIKPLTFAVATAKDDWRLLHTRASIRLRRRRVASTFWNRFAPADAALLADIPTRYKSVCTLISDDLKKWNDLGEISARMKDVENRLGKVDAGVMTREKQAKIVEMLDKKIKDMEDAKNKAEAQANGADQKGGVPGNPNSPAETSQLPTDSGKGEVFQKELQKKMANWGSLPPSEREKITQQMTQNLPPKYKPMIEAYFKSLNQQGSK